MAITDTFKGKKLYRVGVVSLGCDKNRIDTEKMLYRVRHFGHTIVNDIELADVVIVNTCAFIGDAREESVNTVMEVSGNNRKVIVTGCLPQKFIGEIMDTFTEADGFLGTADYSFINHAIDAVTKGQRYNGVGAAAAYRAQADKNSGLKSSAGLSKSSSGEVDFGGDNFDLESDNSVGRIITTAGHYAYLMISDGCDNNCSYCLIPKIRGKYRSFSTDSILKEARMLIAGGVKELILVAQDLTRYGSDFSPSSSLVQLLRELSKISELGDNSIRLMYCYPERITDALIAEIAANSKIIKYIDMPLQHVSDSILKRMRRASTYDGIIKLTEKLRSEVPGISIRSTFIVGFPGETQQDFDTLTDFLQKVKLDNAGFFMYSRERETDAYNYTPRINKSTAKERHGKALALQQDVHKTLNSQLKGQTVTVVCDGRSQDDANVYIGRTYKSAPMIDRSVVFTAEGFADIMPGDSVQVVIYDYDGCDVYGKAVKF